MRKIYVIAAREYNAMVRTKAFLVTILIMPILMFGAIFLQKGLEGRVDVADKTIVVLDGTGVLVPQLGQQLDAANEREVYDPETKRQLSPKLKIEAGPAGPITDEIRLAISERVRKNELVGFVELDPRILNPPAPEPGKPAEKMAVAYAENLNARQAIRRFERVLNNVVESHRLHQANIDPVLVAMATADVPFENLGLYVKSADGTIKKADSTGSSIAQLAPLGLLLLMFMSIMIAAQPMLQSVLEEKQQRIAEVLLGSAKPFDLMMGKLLGNVAVSLTILGIYLLGIYSTASNYGYVELLPMQLLGWFLVYEILAVLMFGSIFIAVGAACTDLKEAQNYLMPVSLLMVFPMMVWFPVMGSPMSTFSTVISFIPLGTPMLMPLRMSASSSIPMWQPLLGVILVLAFTSLCVFAAGRIFRIGLLSQGKAPKVSELMRWIISG